MTILVAWIVGLAMGAIGVYFGLTRWKGYKAPPVAPPSVPPSIDSTRHV